MDARLDRPGMLGALKPKTEMPKRPLQQTHTILGAALRRPVCHHSTATPRTVFESHHRTTMEQRVV